MGKLTKLMGSSAPAPSIDTASLKAASEALRAKAAGSRETTARMNSARADLAAARNAVRDVDVRLGEAELRGDEAAIGALSIERERALRRVEALERREAATPNARRAEVVAIEAAQSDLIREFGSATRQAMADALTKLKAAAETYLAARAVVTALRLEPAEPLPPRFTNPETGDVYQPAFSPEDEALIHLASETMQAISAANSAANAAAVGPGGFMGFAPVRRAG